LDEVEDFILLYLTNSSFHQIVSVYHPMPASHKH